MEALTRLYLLRAPAAGAAYGQGPRRDTPIDGALDPQATLRSDAAGEPGEPSAGDLDRLLARLDARPLDAVVSSTSLRARRVAEALSRRRELPLTVEPRLAPRHLGSWQGRTPESLGEAWGRFLADRRHAPSDAEPLESVAGRVLAAIEQLAREHPRREIAVVLHFDGVRALLARAVGLEDALPLELEHGSIAALDWAHPEAREFQHALVAVALDRDVAPPPASAHRYPGGASVLPGGR